MTGIYSNPDEPPSENTEQAGYQLEKIVVTPTEENNPAAFEYSDLRRSKNKSTTEKLIHATYWPIYILFLFPLQYMYRALKFKFWSTHITPAGRLGLMLRGGFRNLQKLKFLINRDRRTVYLRASRIITPAQIFPFIPGTSPIKEEPSANNLPRPENWKTIRQAVYERDNYHCVNCGAGGGQYGNAELHADHVIPRSKGGADTPENLRTLCRSCHEARHARMFR